MSSKTTVQLDRKTKELLDRIKHDTGAASYAEVIRELAKKAKAFEGGELGSLPKLGRFQRDEHDRLD